MWQDQIMRADLTELGLDASFSSGSSLDRELGKAGTCTNLSKHLYRRERVIARHRLLDARLYFLFALLDWWSLEAIGLHGSVSSFKVKLSGVHSSAELVPGTCLTLKDSIPERVL